MLKEIWECDYCHCRQMFYNMSRVPDLKGAKMYNYCQNNCVDPSETIKGKSRFTCLGVLGDDGVSLKEIVDKVRI